MGARFRHGGRRLRVRSVSALKGVRHSTVRAMEDRVEVKALRPRAKARRKEKVLVRVKERKEVARRVEGTPAEGPVAD